jgi:hypothetical protein
VANVKPKVHEHLGLAVDVALTDFPIRGDAARGRQCQLGNECGRS